MKDSIFIETLEELAFGTALMDVDKKLAKAVEASKKTGKVSSITLTLKIKPIMGKDVPQVEIIDTCKVSIPEAEHSATTMYSTDDIPLSAEHPEVRRKRKLLEEKNKNNITKLGGDK